MGEYKGYKEERPKLKLPLSKIEIVVIALGAAFILFSAVYLVVIWENIPEVIAKHFGTSGKADSWGSKTSLIFLSVVGAVLYSGLLSVSFFPQVANYPIEVNKENAEEVYILGRKLLIYLSAEVSGIFAFIQYQSIQVSMGKASSLGRAFLPITLILVFGTLGYFIFKMTKIKGKRNKYLT